MCEPILQFPSANSRWMVNDHSKRLTQASLQTAMASLRAPTSRATCPAGDLINDQTLFTVLALALLVRLACESESEGPNFPPPKQDLYFPSLFLTRGVPLERPKLCYILSRSSTHPQHSSRFAPSVLVRCRKIHRCYPGRLSLGVLRLSTKSRCFFHSLLPCVSSFYLFPPITNTKVPFLTLPGSYTWV